MRRLSGLAALPGFLKAHARFSEAPANGCFFTMQDRSDFRRRKVLKVPKDQDRPVFLGNGFQNAAHFLFEIERFAGIGDGRIGAFFDAAVAEQQRPDPPPPLPQEVESQVDPDAEKPRPKPPRGIELIEPFVHPQKRFLSQIAGQLAVADEPQQHPHQPVFVPADKNLKGGMVAAADFFDQARIAHAPAGR